MTSSPAEPGEPTGRAPRLVLVVAHPDDETFGCGSVLLHAAARGAHTVVICATRGEAGELADGVDAPHGVGRLREAELRDAAALLGVAEIEVLDFQDSGMDGEPGPQTLCGASTERLGAEIASRLARHRPDVVVTLDGADGHRDHRRIRSAVEELLCGSNTPLYLHALPRSLMHAWVRHHAGDADAAAYTELPDIGTPDELITTVLDTAGHRAVRDAAIAVHRSQASPFRDLPVALQAAFLQTDHLVRVNPVWTGGATERELAGLGRPAATGIVGSRP